MEIAKKTKFRKLVRRIKYTPVDWFTVIWDLKRLGLTHKAIADAIGVAASTITDYTNCSAPSHENGEKLIQLWRREMNQYHVPRLKY